MHWLRKFHPDRETKETLHDDARPQRELRDSDQTFQGKPEAQPHLKSAAGLAEAYDPMLDTLRFSDEGGSELVATPFGPIIHR